MLNEMLQTGLSAEVLPGATSILSLPDEVLIRIVQFLDPQEILIFGSVCKRFLGPSNEDNLVWGRICQAILGAAGATSPDAWHAPTFQHLYTRLLRSYGALLAGPWQGRAEPLGSLLVAFPSPPYIIGAIVVSLRLAEPGVSVVPVFRVCYHREHGDASVICLRGRNMFQSLLQRRDAQGPPSTGPTPASSPGYDDPFQPPETHMAVLHLSFEREDDDEYDGGGGGCQPPCSSPRQQCLGAEATATPNTNDRDDSSRSDLAPAGAQQLSYTMSTSNSAAGGAVAAIAAAAATTSTLTSLATVTAAPMSDLVGESTTKLTAYDVRKDAVHIPPRRRRALCCGVKGARVGNFTFSCSEGCRQLEVEAVCRWAPAGVVTLATGAPTPCTGIAQQHGTRTCTRDVGSSTADSSGSSGNSGGDQYVDMDVRTGHPLRERVHQVAMALYVLLFHNHEVPVSYSPLCMERNLSERGNVDMEGAGPRVGEAVAQRAPPAHALVGLWRGTYGTHGIELLLVQHAGPRLLEARKITGDSNIPAGEASFRIFLDRPGPHAAQRDRPFHLPPDYVSRADVTFMGGRNQHPPGGPGAPSSSANGATAARRDEAVLVLDAFEAQGQVAGIMYDSPQWISAEAVVLGHHTFGILWHDLQSFSAFRRIKLPTAREEGFNLLPP